MGKVMRPFGRVAVAILIILLVTMAKPGEATPGEGREIPEGWALFPRLGLSVEYGGYLVQTDAFTSLLRRRLEIDLLQYRRHIFYMEFDEQTFIGTPADKWDFNLMRYDINLGGYRYDLGEYYLGLFVHHQCNNPFQGEKYRGLVNRARANLYYVGLEFLTKTMRLGMKNRGINFDSPQAFEFLGRWHGAASVNRVIVKENADLDWLLKAQVRYDIFRYYRLVPYVEAGVDVLVANSATRAAPSVEVGTRYHLSRVDFTPFFKWSRNQEFITERLSPTTTILAAKNSLYGGARLEVLLDADTLSPAKGIGQVQLFPEIHGSADYGLHLRSRFFNGLGSVELDFEALRYDPWTVFVYTGMKFDSRKEDFKPDKVIYNLQYGLTYGWQNYFVEGFLDQRKRLDANIFRGTEESTNLAGLRAGTKGMKPGHYNDGISFAGPVTFQWLNKLNGQVSLGHYFQNRDWQYLWDLTAQARWDICRWRFVVPYLQGGVNWLSGGGRTDDAVEYSVEPGLRFHGVLDVALYYRFQHRENVIFFRGPSENQSIVGIKALF